MHPVQLDVLHVLCAHLFSNKLVVVERAVAQPSRKSPLVYVPPPEVEKRL